MKKLPSAVVLLLIQLISIQISFCQDVRDTSMFKEHQVLFEQMDYIPHIKELKMQRILNEDTSCLVINGDPYWISSLVSNDDYHEYLGYLKSDSSIEIYDKALPCLELRSGKIETLNITFEEYFNKNN